MKYFQCLDDSSPIISSLYKTFVFALHDSPGGGGGGGASLNGIHAR